MKTPYYTPMPNFGKMSQDQLRLWLEEQVDWLCKKQARELNYLQRRAKRGTHTPTDDAYNDDQSHEIAVIAFLEHFKKTLDKV